MSSYSDFQVDLNNKNSSWTILYNKIDKNSKILDIGCSSGYFDKALIESRDCIVDGVELDPEDARKASGICRKVLTENIEDAAFPWAQLDDDYDYILFVDVLEHLIDPSAALRNVSKRLAKNGKILFSIPNMANGSVRLQLLQGNFDYELEGLLDETHLHYYTGQTIEKMVRDSGLVLTEVDFTTFDVPKAYVEKVASSVGLKLTDEFLQYIRQGEALAYQYIGSVQTKGASVSRSNVVQALKPKLDYERQLTDMQSDLRRYEADIKELQTALTRSRANLLEVSNTNEKLHQQLDHEKNKGVRRIARNIKHGIVKLKK